MKDNMLVGFSFILCGEFHGISMGAYVKKVSTKSVKNRNRIERLTIESIGYLLAILQ